MKTEKANICIECANACGGCSWSKNFTPVEGWTAEKVVRTVFHGNEIGNTEEVGYHITWCPEFVDEKDKEAEYKDEGLMRLAEAVYKRAGEDYRSDLRAITDMRKDWQNPITTKHQRELIVNRYRRRYAWLLQVEKFLGETVCKKIRKVEGFKNNEELDDEIRFHEEETE